MKKLPTDPPTDMVHPSPPLPSSYEGHIDPNRRLSSFSSQEALGGSVFPTEGAKIRELDSDDNYPNTMDTAEGGSTPPRPMPNEALPEEEENVSSLSSPCVTCPRPCCQKANRSVKPERPQRLVSKSASYRISGNRLFESNLLLPALDAYNLALSSCPTYLTDDIAVIQANIAAVELKLQHFPEAVKAATKALEGRPGWLKALYRRARAQEGVGSWASLQAALEDYKTLAQAEGTDGMRGKDMEIVRDKLTWLPRRIEESKEQETAEVLVKLKEMGDGLLRPFGLSTQNFGMVQDANGGYSVQFRGSQ